MWGDDILTKPIVKVRAKAMKKKRKMKAMKVMRVGSPQPLAGTYPVLAAVRVRSA